MNELKVGDLVECSGDNGNEIYLILSTYIDVDSIFKFTAMNIATQERDIYHLDNGPTGLDNE